MGVMTDAVVREKEPCRKCGAPRTTLFVPSGHVEFTHIVKKNPRDQAGKEETVPIKETLVVTSCLRCDCVTWQPAEEATE